MEDKNCVIFLSFNRWKFDGGGQELCAFSSFEIGQVLTMEDKNCEHSFLLLSRTSIDDVRPFIFWNRTSIDYGGQELCAFFGH
jgi:hypothetical protein